MKAETKDEQTDDLGHLLGELENGSKVYLKANSFGKITKSEYPSHYDSWGPIKSAGKLSVEGLGKFPLTWSEKKLPGKLQPVNAIFCLET